MQTHNAASDGTFTGELLLGTYKLMAFNANAEGGEFRSLETLEGASVHLNEIPALSNASLTVMSPIGDVYVLTVDEVVVQAQQDAAYTPTPVLRTHTLTLNLDMSHLLTPITGVSGTLNGVYASLPLSTGEPMADVVAASPTQAVYFSRAATGTEVGGIHPVVLQTLGIQDLSAVSGSHTNRLQLTITTTDGNLTADVDITTLIAAATDADGRLPSGKALEIYVVPNSVEPGTGGDIEGWEPGNPGEGDHEGGLH